LVRLTKYTDYALRVLMYLAARPEQQASVGEIAKAYSISQNHLTKVVHNLGLAGYVATARGRGGGMRLARAQAEINVGEVVRRFEDGFDLVDCGSCVVSPSCRLRVGLDEAVRAFLAVLDGYTLADLMGARGGIVRLLGISSDK
jgi:Rrf2 family transcriptional regulator, nitric oxide-sensitive transcriptional repressor